MAPGLSYPAVFPYRVASSPIPKQLPNETHFPTDLNYKASDVSPGGHGSAGADITVLILGEQQLGLPVALRNLPSSAQGYGP